MRVARLDPAIGRITPILGRHHQERPEPDGITTGSDHRVWFTELRLDRIARIESSVPVGRTPVAAPTPTVTPPAR